MTPINTLQFFKESYNRLNPEQRIAVDALDGPVMIIAGPGTGKTQILATRIANLLHQGVTEAENILCLTYTDAGALAMKKRLAELIGLSSRNVSIHTFHSFCNRVIQENPNVFYSNVDFRIAEKLDECEVLEELLIQLSPKDIHYRPDQNYKPILNRIIQLFNTIKKENWNSDELSSVINKYIIEMKGEERFLYTRKYMNFQKGDLKQKIYDEEVSKYKQTLSAIGLYKEYNKSLRNKKLLDYNDLINSVINEFESNDQLLLNYQEKFQYFLVDEFQDTNGSQLEILSQLISYWDSPNVFVVGDGDQAIFRFQGANVKNLIDFRNKYKPMVINLVENYRSTQAILEAADSFISLNKERLIIEDSGSNTLKANSESENIKPVIKIYKSPIEEVSDVVHQIENLIKIKKVAPYKIAVLFRKNADSEEFSKELIQRNIDFSLSKEINVITYPLIEQILSIIAYLQMEYEQAYQNDFLLYEILHSSFIDIGTKDIGLLSYYIHTSNKSNQSYENGTNLFTLRQACNDEEFLIKSGISNPSQFLDIGKIVNNLLKDKNNLTLQNFIEKILYDFKIIPYIVAHTKNLEALEVIHSFYEFIKQISIRYADINLKILTQMIDRLKSYNLTIPYLKIISSEDTVRLSTVHSAKGLEYSYVFMVKNSASSNRQTPSFKIPPDYSYSESGTDMEDDRRVFYVGMTRAEKQLQISYSNSNMNGKSLEASSVVKEMESINSCIVQKAEIDQELIIQTVKNQLSYIAKKYELINENLIDKFLENFILSSTSMESYLRCPIDFYYERILSVPIARNVYMGFGSAIHRTLEEYLKRKPDTQFIDIQLISELFRKYMNQVKSNFTNLEYASYIQQGLEYLPKFIEQYSKEWKNLADSEFELNLKNKFYKSIPIAGKIDRLDPKENGFEIIDYKTGKASTQGAKEKVKVPSEKHPHGGEYWRQMVFYSLLCDSDTSLANKVTEGSLYYVIPNIEGEFFKYNFHITAQDKEIVGTLIELVYFKIQNKEFTEGCGKETCKWCNHLNFDFNKQNNITEETLEY
ncbi:MAG: ATP-dependent DNA helicase [Saprospiraceae bacterium]